MDKKKKFIIYTILIVMMLAVLYILEQVLPASSMLFVVLKKGAIYALVAVSMNLLYDSDGGPQRRVPIL